MKLPIVIIGAIVIAVLAAGGGFFGGMTYAQSQAQSTANTFLQQRAVQNGQGGGAQGGGQLAANDPCGFGGRFTQNRNGGQTNGQSGQGNFQGQQRQGGQNGGAFGGPFGDFAQLGNCVARGQIKAVNGNTIEISTATSVVTVKVNDQTLISKTDRGTLADLQPGDRVTVFSKETGDSPTASTIQLQRPITQTQQTQ